MIAARQPRSPSWRMMPGTVAGGVQISASVGRLRQVGHAGVALEPGHPPYFGLTG